MWFCVLVSTVCRLCQRYVGCSVARGFIFLVGFSSLSYFYWCLSFPVQGVVCVYTARRADHGTHVWAGQGHVFDDTPVQAPGPELDQAEA